MEATIKIGSLVKWYNSNDDAHIRKGKVASFDEETVYVVKIKFKMPHGWVPEYSGYKTAFISCKDIVEILDKNEVTTNKDASY